MFPPDMSNEDLMAEVLRQVNAVRVHFNAGPLDCLPHGDRRRCLSCPLKQALDCGFLRVEIWNAGYIRAYGYGARVKLAESLGTHLASPLIAGRLSRRELGTTTPAMREFIERFDRGDIPELDEAATDREPALVA